jgi:lysophospholipase L1-like esterase
MPNSHSSRRQTRLLLSGAAVAMLVVLAGCTASRLRDAAELARLSEPLQRHVEQPRARLLIVGDSTAVGTGASAPGASLAGLLAQAYPGLHIENRGRDGATLGELPQQLQGTTRFDAVLILAGGNDVIRLRDLDKARDQLDGVIRQARLRADSVVLMPAGNVGNAPFFFPPLSWWMSSRSRQFHSLVQAAAAQQGASYVNLYKERADDPFAQRPELNARDGLHPSDEGYQLWFKELMAQSSLAQQLAAARAPAS